MAEVSKMQEHFSTGIDGPPDLRGNTASVLRGRC